MKLRGRRAGAAKGTRRGMTWSDVVDEAAAGVASRPARLVLTTLGTVLGIAALVATIGVSQTAAGQVSQRFNEVQATRVVVEAESIDAGDDSVAAAQLPWDAPERVSRLAGVESAGIYSVVPAYELVSARAVSDGTDEGRHDVPVVAVSPGLFPAVRAELRTGRFFDAGHDERGDRVAVLGEYAAQRLGVNRVDSQPSVFVGDRSFTVIGILESVAGRAELQDALIMPSRTARDLYGLAAPQAVEIRTELGAAQQVGRQASIAVGPNHPDRFRVDAPPAPGSLREDVQADINALFMALGGVALLIGAVGIANITLLSVMERVPEIGLRRAVGATRRQVALQFLMESAVVGLLGGLIGTTAGVLVTVGVSAVRDWTALLDLRLAVAAPLLGAVIGLLAGAYPAWRAASIEPITALRAA